MIISARAKIALAVIALAGVIALHPVFVASLAIACLVFSAIGISGAWIVNLNHERAQSRSNTAFRSA